VADVGESAAPSAQRRRWRPGLAGQVLIGLALGLATGLFFGELAGGLKIVGDIFIGLLQMTVLPYILVSLMAALGRLSYAEVRTLALKGGVFVLVVRDHERSRFLDAQRVKSDGTLRIAMPDVPYYRKLVRAAPPNAKIVTIKSPRDFFRAKEGTFDALLYTAEAGSAWTLVFPDFTVVVPKPHVIATSTAFALPRSAPALYDYVSTWIALKKKEGVIQHLYDYWILGRGAKSTKPRWSVIRDVLGWIE